MKKKQSTGEKNSAIKDVTDREKYPTLATKRRSFLGVLGISAVAGCSDVYDMNHEESEDSKQSNEQDGLRDPITTYQEIISTHKQALENTSYTISAKYQGKSSNSTIDSKVEYKYDADKESEILEKDTVSDSSTNKLRHIRSGSQRLANITFENGESTTISLGESEEKPERLTGEGILDYYLDKSTFGEPYEDDHDGVEKSVTAYDIRSHRSYDTQGGTLKIDDNDIVRYFRLEWLDNSNETHWIEFNLLDLGETTNNTSLDI